MTTRQDDLKTLCARGDLNSSQTGSISVHPRSSETFLSVESTRPHHTSGIQIHRWRQYQIWYQNRR
jgi:hypothetical protein